MCQEGCVSALPSGSPCGCVELVCRVGSAGSFRGGVEWSGHTAASL